MSVLFVYTTFPDAESAERAAHIILEKRLAACANIWASHKSLYWWGDGIQSAGEHAVVLKTTEGVYEDLEAELQRLHPYDCPCIVAWPVAKGYAPYLEWVRGETASK